MTSWAPGGSVVLVVEDNPGDAELIGDLLSACGYEKVVHVGTLAAALEQVAAAAIDVVLLDLGLPDATGSEGVERLRAQTSELAIVVLTGSNDDELALRCLRAGAQDYICKEDVRADNLRRAIGYSVARLQAVRERRRADALQERLAAIVESTHDAIVSSTIDGTITSWNRGAERIFGFRAEEAVGRPVSLVMRPADDDALTDQARRIAAAQAGETPAEAQEVVRLTKDGRAIVLSVVGSTLRDPVGRAVGLAAICRDVTESKRRDAELRLRNEELVEQGGRLRALMHRLNAVREEERRRISREVHDELGQLLTGVRMDLRWVEKRLSGAPGAETAVAKRLAEADHLLDATMSSVRRIALELRPSALDVLGLPGALRDEARRFGERSGLEVEMAIPDILERAPSDVETGLFRIAQELMTNIARHAKATSMRIALLADPKGWELVVEDDGIGFGAETQRRQSGLGLLGMHERAAALGGTLTMRRRVEHGTLATVRVPKEHQLVEGRG